jgi:ElaB/YqjD/DUF883 family membrane-anchored ribosome-binding protein
MTPEEKRVMLRSKIDTSMHRLADYVPPEPIADPLPVNANEDDKESAAAEFVKRYPIAVVGGAVALGLLLGSHGKKAAVTAAKDAVKKPAKRPNIIATLLIDAIIGYGLKMIDKSREQGSKSDA